MANSIIWLIPMNFPSRLIQIRKAQGLTQRGLAEAVERLGADEQDVIHELLEGMIVKYGARSWTQANTRAD